MPRLPEETGRPQDFLVILSWPGTLELCSDSSPHLSAHSSCALQKETIRIQNVGAAVSRTYGHHGQHEMTYGSNRYAGWAPSVCSSPQFSSGDCRAMPMWTFHRMWQWHSQAFDCRATPRQRQLQAHQASNPHRELGICRGE